MKEIVKICKIHGDLTLDQSYFRKARGTYECRECMRESEKKRPKREYTGAFADYHREHSKQWRRKNSDYMNEKIREDRKLNPEKYRQWERDKRNKDVEKSRYRDVLKKHKITADEYNSLLENQNGLCAICNLEETKKSKTAGNVCRLSLDHCHSTGKIRGLLCHHCNAAIGHFKDDPNLLQSAINYLNSHIHN